MLAFRYGMVRRENFSEEKAREGGGCGEGRQYKYMKKKRLENGGSHLLFCSSMVGERERGESTVHT